MSARTRLRFADQAGFTLIEVLMATLLMTVILGALAVQFVLDGIRASF